MNEYQHIALIYRDALIAIEARIKGVFDSPALKPLGPLGSTEDDILRIISNARIDVTNLMMGE